MDLEDADILYSILFIETTPVREGKRKDGTRRDKRYREREVGDTQIAGGNSARADEQERRGGRGEPQGTRNSPQGH
jgi:hypothetical protein